MRTPSKALALAAALTVASPTVLAQCSLTTLFASNNGGSVGGAVYFDVQVHNAVQITAIAINTSVGAGTPIGLDVYITLGSHLGNETNPAAWSLRTSDDGTGVAAGLDTPSLVPLQTPLLLSPGSHGIALVARNFNHRYTNGSGTNQQYAGGDFSLSLGSATNVPFTGSVFRPRVWNGSLLCERLIPRFTSTNPAGQSPWTVTFTDQSWSRPPGSIYAWNWDLDGDGLVDSTQRNPTFTYPHRGFFDVSLTVFDHQHGTATVRRSAWVHVLSNDECTSAIALGDGTSGPFSNRGATTSFPWPCALGGKDVWFEYTATCDRNLVIDTCTSPGFDTSIEVFEGSCSTLRSIACNDDACGLQSRVSFPATGGSSYWIRVGGYNAAEGTFWLSIRGCTRLQVAGAAIGDSLGFVLEGDPNELFLLIPSLTHGPTPLALVDPLDARSLDVGLDLPSLWVSGRLDAQGNTAVFYALPNDRTLVGLQVHAQYLTVPGTTTLVDDLSNPVSTVCLASSSVLRCRYVVTAAAGGCGGIGVGSIVCLPCPDPNAPLPDNCPVIAGCVRAAPACALSVRRFSQYCLYCPGTFLGAGWVCK